MDIKKTISVSAGHAVLLGFRHFTGPLLGFPPVVVNGHIINNLDDNLIPT
jgi:hypothetical protein